MDVVLIYLALLGTLIVIAFLPAIIAFRRGHPSRWAILVVCLVFGATVIGWVVALIWALGLLHLPWDDQLAGDGGSASVAGRRAEVSLTYGATPLPGGPPVSKRIAELEKLIKLRKGGFINAAEYERMKMELLKYQT